jgi:hypothetical protein
MAEEAKTKFTRLDPALWLETVDPSRRSDAETLLALFQGVTGWTPQLWGPTIAGFGRYEYRYESGHSGEAPATGFSPRKPELVIYIMPGYAAFAPLLDRLGPHRIGKSCLYLKRLDRVDLGTLEELIRAGLTDLGTRWPLHPA